MENSNLTMLVNGLNGLFGDTITDVNFTEVAQSFIASGQFRENKNFDVNKKSLIKFMALHKHLHSF